MTGNCLSKRALELIEKCASRVYKTEDCRAVLTRNKLDGSPKDFNILNNMSRTSYYTSPIENFLYRYAPYCFSNSRKIKKLIDFLKDETKVLRF